MVGGGLQETIIETGAVPSSSIESGLYPHYKGGHLEDQPKQPAVISYTSTSIGYLYYLRRIISKLT